MQPLGRARPGEDAVVEIGPRHAVARHEQRRPARAIASEEERALAQFYEDNFIPLWQQKSNDSKLLDTWVSAILAMDDTTKTKKESRMNPDSNPAQSCGSPISLNNKPGSYGKQNPKLLNISGVSKQRRKTKTRPSENSPQSIGGVRTVRGLEFLNRL